MTFRVWKIDGCNGVNVEWSRPGEPVHLWSMAPEEFDELRRATLGRADALGLLHARMLGVEDALADHANHHTKNHLIERVDKLERSESSVYRRIVELEAWGEALDGYRLTVDSRFNDDAQSIKEMKKSIDSLKCLFDHHYSDCACRSETKVVGELKDKLASVVRHEQKNHDDIIAMYSDIKKIREKLLEASR
jgi:hypothetical protein